jgi:hypothetical protein
MLHTCNLSNALSRQQAGRLTLHNSSRPHPQEHSTFLGPFCRAFKVKRARVQNSVLSIARPTLGASSSAKGDKSGELYRSASLGMAGVSSGQGQDVKAGNRVKGLFAGAMPKEEIGALRFLKVGP